MSKGVCKAALFLASVLLFVCLPCGAQNLAITSASVYVSPEAALQKDMTIVIRNGVVTEVGKHLPVPAGMKTLSCNACFVFAGFWNAHVHFMEPKWNDAAGQAAQKLTRQMTEMITHSGFTTVVDVGSLGENTIALRRRVDSGEVLGPRILTSGVPLFPAHSLPYYIPEDLRPKLAQPDTPAEAVQVVARNRALGTDIVKLFTGSIVGPDHIVPMRTDIAKAAVVEAHRHGQLVFAHTTNLEGTQVAMDAGVDVLAHTPEVTNGFDEARLRRIIALHMTIIPTFKLFSGDREIAKLRALDFRFHQLGGRIVYGTDTGFLSDYDQGEEFRQLSTAGFTFRDILAMLTTAPVELFHLSTDEGTLAPGKRGDLTILMQDPASGSPDAFTKVMYTIRGGKIIWRAQ